ncbi:MAG TPA: Na+-transporting NADH:ubiquinone oxidoreductase subunit G [Prevotella sp.]|nr:Na+-transporting NADH:ubiquinone oxidoreductase subunit G [Prevotella sp.]
MKKLKSSLTNMVVVLVSCALVTGGLLAYVNHVTERPIALQSEKTLADGIKAVMGGGNLRVTANDTVRQDMGGKTYLFVVHKTSQGGKEIGAAVESTTQGFGGDLKVLVGFDHQGTILGYTILSSSETPGLGAKAGQWFQKDGKGNIIGKSPAKGDLTVSKDGGDVDAITASTITSRAFLKAVNQAYHAYMQKAVDGHSGASQQVKKG